MKKNKKILIILVASILMVGGLLFMAKSVFASSTDGTIDSTYKYAWSENTGWINFKPTNSEVHVTDAGLSGYALSETVGWIYLGDITNDGNGNLSGYAWGENVGWIKFNPTNGGVIINSSGEFTGSALGENIGWIIFDGDYNVKTDWRPRSVRPACNNAIDDDGDGKIDYPADPGCSSLDDTNETDVGGGGGGNYNPPAPPENGFRIEVNSNNQYTNNSIVSLSLFGGSDTTRMAISNFSDFRDSGQENYQTAKTWTLTEGDGPKTVYAKFYTQNGQPSLVVSDTIIFDITPPEIRITNSKDAYSIAEDVLFMVETETKAEIILRWDKKYGLIHADQQGKVIINLGKMLVGAHQLEMTATDLAGNKGKTLIVSLTIKSVEEMPAVTLKEPKKSLIEKLESLIPEFLKPEKEEEKSEEMIIISEETPLAFQINRNLLVSYTLLNKSMVAFTQAPLPKEIMKLAEKFPELAKTLTKIGVTKLTDLEALQTVNLILPGLTERIGSSLAKIESGQLALLQGIPMSDLSFASKQKIPTEIVFTKTGGGLIDYNITLSIGEQGQPQQQINTISGQPLELVIKPDQPVKSIKGYLVFKARASQPTSSQSLFNQLAASLIFANPVFARPVSNQPLIFVEGSKPQSESSNLLGSLAEIPVPITVVENSNKDGSIKVEEALVLLAFEYTDPDGDGIYVAEIQVPVVEGEYEIITVLNFLDPELGAKEIRLITVVDPEGYIYTKIKNQELRIKDAIVSLYWLNRGTKQYEIWPAKEYQQENSQITDITGKYSFLVPVGTYYLKVEAPGYLAYEGEAFEVKEGRGIHKNIELKNKSFWLRFDWQTVLLIFVTILLLMVTLLLFYNFCRDKIREKN